MHPETISNEVIDPATQAVSVPLADNIFVPRGDANARVRALLDVALSSCGNFAPSREVSMIKTKVDEALLWLSKVPAQSNPQGTLPGQS